MNAFNAARKKTVDESEPQTRAALCKRLVLAKMKLDRLKQDGASRDLSALSAARVEFALASRALADVMVAEEETNELSAC